MTKDSNQRTTPPVFSGMLSIAILGLLFSGSAVAASSITLDGIKTSGSEYTGGVFSGSREMLWFNDHESIYTVAANNKNTLLWEINDNGGTDKYSLNVFFEVPTYARRMIWQGENKDSSDACFYTGGAPSTNCAPLDPDGDQAYLEAYQNGSHHDDNKDGFKDVKMDYNTQVGSEYFRLNTSEKTGSGDDKDMFVPMFQKKWTDSSPGSGDTWATSLQYVLDPLNGTGCTKDQCLEFNRSASIEVFWTGLANLSAAEELLASIDNMQLHLSDEARGLPPFIPEVPVPAAFWLFGTALIGFIGISRRTSLS